MNMDAAAPDIQARGIGAGRLRGKVAIVTGAGSAGPGWGNGKAVAVAFAREGAAVHLVDRNAAAANQTREIISGEGGTCSVHVADVSDAAQVDGMVLACEEQYGRIDILHNNVGVAMPGSALSIDVQDWERAFQVNVASALLASRRTAPMMIRQRGGSIINVSSISSLRVLTGLTYVSYPATKAALNHLTRVMAVEWAPYQIRCNAILPGFINTPMVGHSVLSSVDGAGESPDLQGYLDRRVERIPMRRWGDAWDIANAAVFLASDESRYITGIDMLIDGGASLLAG